MTATQTTERKNRIQIVNWRRHGDDESYDLIAAFGADEDTEVEDLIREELDYDGSEGEDYIAEDAGDWDKTYYINNDTTIEDGQIWEDHGRKFRINITEVTEELKVGSRKIVRPEGSQHRCR